MAGPQSAPAQERDTTEEPPDGERAVQTAVGTTARTRAGSAAGGAASGTAGRGAGSTAGGAAGRGAGSTAGGAAGRGEDAAAESTAEATRPIGVRVTQAGQTRNTLVEGSTFCVCGPRGDIGDAPSQGLFVQDTRVISRWQLLVDGSELDPLATVPLEPFECVFVCRAPTRPGRMEPTVVVERHRMVAEGMREDVTIRNYGLETVGLDLTLHVESDFADLFEVKENRAPGVPRRVEQRAEGSELMSWYDNGLTRRGVRISIPGARAVSGSLVLRAVVEPQSSWTTNVQVLTSEQGHEHESRFPTNSPIETTVPVRRLRDWREDMAKVTVENTVLSHALDVSAQDLGALRITSPDHPEDEVIAAGAPWFMTLFGRDSLITSWMTLPFAPRLALGTLRTLARLQGRRSDAMSEEEPGRILHEVRSGIDPAQALGASNVYYGSIDATPLFVMVAGRLLTWGSSPEELAPLRGAVEAAIAWIDQYGDRDDDGFVEYQRRTDRGLPNQGWKDSSDSMVFADGRNARAPIALSEVQGYCYAALLAGARLEESWGDAARAAAWRARAATLKSDFHRAFWDEAQGFYAMALDGKKHRLDVVSSNIGHCLWTGIVDDSVADRVVDRLMRPDMFSGFGVRTLASSCAAFNPASYHCGSVWPHDTVITAAGMAAYGRRDAATTVVRGLLDALEAFDGRLPELFCGFDRGQMPAPVPYPTSCSPQAWSAATPFEILRLSLGLEADIPRQTLHVGPTPEALGRVRLDNVPLNGHRARILADPTSARVEGVGSGIHVDIREEP